MNTLPKPNYRRVQIKTLECGDVLTFGDTYAYDVTVDGPPEPTADGWMKVTANDGMWTSFYCAHEWIRVRVY